MKDKLSHTHTDIHTHVVVVDVIKSGVQELQKQKADPAAADSRRYEADT